MKIRIMCFMMKTLLLNDASYIKKLNKILFLLLHLFIVFIAFILIVSKIHVKMNEGDICIVDYETTHNYLR